MKTILEHRIQTTSDKTNKGEEWSWYLYTTIEGQVVETNAGCGFNKKSQAAAQREAEDCLRHLMLTAHERDEIWPDNPLMLLPPLLRQLSRYNIPYGIDASGRVTVGGFYKSGTVLLTSVGKEWDAECRYHEHTRITGISDLCLLNMDWWERSKDRGVEEWKQPDRNWVKALIADGFIQADTHTVTTYKPKR